MTVYRLVMRALKKIPNSNHVTEVVCDKFSGYLQADAKYISVRGGLAGHTKLPGRTRPEGLNLAEKIITKLVKIKLFGDFSREALVSVKEMLGE